MKNPMMPNNPPIRFTTGIFLSFFVPTIIIVMLVSIVGFNTYYHYKK